MPRTGDYKTAIPDLAELIAAGWRVGDIARKYGLDYRQVWWRIRREGIAYQADRSGRNNGAWNGGRRHSENYIYVWYPEHPFATKAGTVLEHRLVMEAKLGRYLHPKEVVHHKKGYANNLGNLVLYHSNGAHLADTLKGQVPKWTPEGRRRILEAVSRPRGQRKKPTPAK